MMLQMVFCVEKLTRRSTIVIQSVITHRCTKCNSMNIVKNGTDYKGKQKFHFTRNSGGGVLPFSKSRGKKPGFF
ncbi:MAG: hypothetical protein DRJ03_18515 [Chloroflexi bacterium]|nr:MAG: hypothetical protein B6I35_05460 [Anaerolineaceae bacterium 4572_32.2]RLC82748.1 MAG: hypothetical protein DRJ03_18515 [Chloroflexota bacterium]